MKDKKEGKKNLVRRKISVYAHINISIKLKNISNDTLDDIIVSFLMI